MKRELKGYFGSTLLGGDVGFTHHPDEEGTESKHIAPPCPRREGFTHHPDEEGTESIVRASGGHAGSPLHTPSR